MSDPHYIEDILKKAKDLPPGIYKVDVLHDDLCNFWDRKQCNCNVETNIKKEK